MTNKLSTTALPLAPREYNIEYMNRLIKQLNLTISKMNSVGPIIVGSDLTGQVAGYPVSGLSIINVPTSNVEPVNLPDWSVWCDTSNNNVLKIKIPS